MQIRGAIYYHPSFEFTNGETGKKLIILLNTPAKKEPYIFVKTTSQQKDKPLSPGCIKKRNLYFIPAGKSFFQENTWIELYERYVMMPEDVDKNKDMKVIGSLDSKTVDKIINCLFAAQDDDIPMTQRKLLRPPIINGILKLKEKFNLGK